MSLRPILDRMLGRQALVIGDAMYDEYHFGRVDRISPEAPVPVFTPGRVEIRPGGAANVAEQITALGMFCWMSFPQFRSRKKRFMVGHQMLFRVDQDVHSSPTNRDVTYALDLIVPGLSVIVLSDYAKGWLTPDFCQAVISKATAAQIPVIVDPKGQDWSKYRGASLICPNQAEMKARVVHADAYPMTEAMLVKLGAEGMKLEVPGQPVVQIPAVARHVFDVCGAGDTVVAVTAAAIAARAGLEDAARLASLAAGYVVGEVGTATCPAVKLCELVEQSE